MSKSIVATFSAIAKALGAAENNVTKRTLETAAGALVYWVSLGGDNAGRLTVNAELLRHVSEPMSKAIMGWCGKRAYAIYGDTIRANADKDGEEQVSLFVSHLEGDGEKKRTWQDIRGEFRTPKAESTKTEGAPQGQPASFADTVAKLTESQKAAAMVAIIGAMTSMADLNTLASAVSARLAAIASANVEANRKAA